MKIQLNAVVAVADLLIAFPDMKRFDLILAGEFESVCLGKTGEEHFVKSIRFKDGSRLTLSRCTVGVASRSYVLTNCGGSIVAVFTDNKV